MSSSFAKTLVRNRTLLIAFGNAGVTWIILIIAPLGLFAVITSTLAVFGCSFLLGNLCDRAFLYLLSERERQEIDSIGNHDNINLKRQSDRPDSGVRSSELDPQKRLSNPHED